MPENDDVQSKTQTPYQLQVLAVFVFDSLYQLINSPYCYHKFLILLVGRT